MSYYIGFRFGWAQLGNVGIAWKDTRIYRTSARGALRIGCWAITLVHK